MLSPTSYPKYASYFLALTASKRFSDRQVKEFYKTYEGPYGPELEEATLWHSSRVEKAAALESLFICNANGIRFHLKRDVLELAGLQRNGVKLASMRDEWLDNIYVPWLAENGNIDTDRIEAEISDETWRPDILNDYGIITFNADGKNRSFDHRTYFFACTNLQELCSDRLKKMSEPAYDVYADHKKRVEKWQAKDIAIAANLAGKNYRNALDIMGAKDYDGAVSACQGLLDKLGIIGGAIPLIANETTWQNGRDKEAVDRELYALGRETTRFEQLVSDDIPSFEKDLEERNPNMLILTALTSIDAYEEKNYSELISYLKEHSDIIDDLLRPISESMHSAASELGKMGFAGDESKTTLKILTDKGMKKIRSLEERLGVTFENCWYEQAKRYQRAW